jgi:hypothetical protein
MHKKYPPGKVHNALGMFKIGVCYSCRQECGKASMCSSCSDKWYKLTGDSFKRVNPLLFFNIINPSGDK